MANALPMVVVTALPFDVHFHLADMLRRVANSAMHRILQNWTRILDIVATRNKSTVDNKCIPTRLSTHAKWRTWLMLTAKVLDFRAVAKCRVLTLGTKRLVN